jgi:hypothetical protein
MARKPFNWSLLDRYNLYAMLHELGKTIIGKRMPVKVLQKLLSQHIKSKVPVKVVRRQNDYSQKPGQVYMGGTYYSYNDWNDQRQVEIVLSYHPNDTQIKISEYRWGRLCSLFADTMLHEIIHMRQYRSREFKAIPGYESTAHYYKQRMDQQYYGHKDEMGAFAFNIACEMLDKFGNDKLTIQKYMDSLQAKKHKKTSYYRYLKTFDWNYNHPIIQQLKKKVIRNLDYAEIGKPFKTSTHLTY